MFTLGIAVFTLSAAACALVRSGPALVAARVVQGIGGAMTFGTSTAIITSVFPPGQRGHALGINVATVYVGLSLGPVLGGFLTRALGWRAVFISVVPVGIAVMVLALWKLKGEWREPGRFDLAGAAAYGASLLLVMYGFSRLPSAVGGLLVLGGFLSAVGFVLLERRAASPVLDLGLFRRNRVFMFSNLAALVNYSATAAVGFLLSLYLQCTRGLGPERAGLVLVAAPVMQALVSPLAGRLSDRAEPRIVASLGMALTVAGLAVLLLLGPDTATSVVVASLILLGTGFGLFSSPNTNAIMTSVHARDYGVAASMVATVRMVGQMLSMGIVMLLFAALLGNEAIRTAPPAAFLLSMKVAFTVFALLCLAGVFASLARGRLRQPEAG
jgi:MFS family permease